MARTGRRLRAAAVARYELEAQLTLTVLRGDELREFTIQVDEASE